VDDSWQQVGNTLRGDQFGYSVAMSADGSRITVGSPFRSFAGTVSIFQQENDSWQQVGNIISGEFQDDYFGFSVAMSADGSRIAVGSPQNVVGAKGRVRVFGEPTTGSDWTQIGNDIDGKAGGDLFGWSVAMAAGGSRIVVGAIRPFSVTDLCVNDNRGQVRVFEEPTTSSDWIQVGSDIDGEFFEWFGFAVAISAKGSRIVVGAAFTEVQHSIDSGKARIFHQVNESWQRVGNDILSGGHSVALSADGSRIAVGHPNRGYNRNLRTDTIGGVRVFGQPATASPDWI
jgi:hypothetical protein